MSNEPQPVFSVGYEPTYDLGIKNYGQAFRKQGSRPLEGYPGGFAVRSIEDGKRLIAEMGVGRQWAIYLLDAEWTVDTRPSQNGWWHALVRDVVVLRKVWGPE